MLERCLYCCKLYFCALLNCLFLVPKVTKDAVLFLNHMLKALCSVWVGQGVTQETQFVTENGQR